MPDVGVTSQEPHNICENIGLPWYQGQCSVIPIRTDGTKRPYFRWDKFQDMRPLEAEIIEWWKQWPLAGVAIICGRVSGNLELLELEGRATDVDSLSKIEYECKLRAVDAIWDSLLLEGYSEWSPSGGIHVLYRIRDHEVPGNTKLAANRAKECLAETRGEGGYVIVAPTGGQCHPTGEPWETVAGRPGTIPIITWEQRQSIHAAITAALDETPPPPPPVQKREVLLAPDRRRPGDDFNAKAEWSDPWFTGEGWQISHSSRGETFWTRPGKDRHNGHSASTGYAGDADRLYVWSTSTGLPTEQPLSKFFVYAYYHHGGDLTAAAKALAQQGYGERSITKELDIWNSGNGGRTHEVASKNNDIDLTNFGSTDVDNGARLKAVAGQYFHWVPQQNKWMHWDGKVWTIDYKANAVRKAAVRLTDDMLTQGLAEGNDDLIKLANRSRSAGKITAAVDMFELQPGIAAKPENFNADRNLINVGNGVLNLVTGELVPHDPKFMMTKMMGASYRSGATAPTWQTYLDRVLPDTDMQDFVQRMAGYSLTGNPVERAVAVLHGPGRTGKSRFIEALAAVFGTYGATAAESLFRSKRESSGPTNDLHDLRSARLASVSELDDGVRMDEALVKRLSGFDRITSRGLYEENQTWMPQCVIWLATNHHFRVTSDDGAIWDRVKVIPFNEKIPMEIQDPHILEKLLEEADGILNWILEGLTKYRERGLEMPTGVNDAVDAYKAEQDMVLRFLTNSFEEERLILESEAEIEKVMLYQNYVNWCRDNVENPLGQMRFNRRMKALGYEDFKRSRMFWKGIRISHGGFLLGSG